MKTPGRAVAAALVFAMLSSPTLASSGSLDPTMSEAAPPENWRQMIDDRLDAKLRDPHSAVKKVTRAPRFGWLSESVMRTHVGWMVCYSINAKNAYGGYVGPRQHVFVIADGRVVAEFAQPRDRDIVETECSLPAAATDREKGDEGVNPEVGV